MSRHEGVSCDSCLKGNFRGRRYKCLICYDYDLCATCYENGATTTRHTTEHPMQCILTRADFELFYGGEGLTHDQPQSFTCPYCGRMGFTEQMLQEHVTVEHSELSYEVVCPVCASLPVGDPNLVTDDFAGHLTLEHRNPTRDLISFLDEPASRHGARRIPPPSSSRGISSRARRSNMHFSSSGALASISPSSRDNVDPIAELLSQLSGVRRNQGSTPSQLQHLQMQLQLERQQVRAARQQLERLPRRPTANQPSSAQQGSQGNSSLPSDSSPNSSHLMLTRCLQTNLTEAEQERLEQERADKSYFVQDLLLSTLSCTINGEDAEESQDMSQEPKWKSTKLKTDPDNQVTNVLLPELSSNQEPSLESPNLSKNAVTPDNTCENFSSESTVTTKLKQDSANSGTPNSHQQ